MFRNNIKICDFCRIINFDLPISKKSSVNSLTGYNLSKLKYQTLPPTITAILLVVLCFVTISCRKIENKDHSFSKVNSIFDLNDKFGEPFGIAVKDGEIFVSDGEKGKIRRISNYKDFAVLTDKLDTPSAIAFDKNGDLIVADSGSHTIKRVSVSSGEVQSIAGRENESGFADGVADKALFNAPVGVAVADGKIYVADTYNDKIRVVENGKVSTIAGGEKGFADGENAKFDTPCGITVWKDGKILVADSGNRRLRVVEENGNVWTLAGNGENDSVDGKLNEASFVQPLAVTIDTFGVIYVADGNSIRAVGRRFFPFVETISNTRRGFADGSLLNAEFNRPSGLAIDENGNLFVADSENQVLRIFTSEEIGRKISSEEIKSLQFAPEEFRTLGEPRWTYNPPEAKREIAGTLGEIRGEMKTTDSFARFHNGLDIAGGYGETTYFIRTEKVLNPFAVQNFDTSRELVRMPTIGYIHIRLGRDENDKPFEDERFQFIFSKDLEESEKPINLRIPRGTKFEAGDQIGTLNRLNHVHLIAGRSGAEMNALDALKFPNISDSIPPTIEKVLLFDENWREITNENSPIKLDGKTRIVVRAFDRMDGNSERRKLGVYEIGYQILNEDETLILDKKGTISFETLPEPEAVKLVYAVGSQSGATGETVFNYIASNEVHNGEFRENYLNAANLENGKYILRVFAADYFGNTTTEDSLFEVSG